MKLQSLFLLLASAGPVLATPSGLNNIPTADTTPQGTFKGHIPGAISFHWARLMGKDNTHKFKPFAEVKADLEAAGITPDKDILCYCGTSREGSLLRFYLRYVAGYPKVRLYEGAWKEYVWLKNKSLPAELEAPKKP